MLTLDFFLHACKWLDQRYPNRVLGDGVEVVRALLESAEATYARMPQVKHGGSEKTEKRQR